MKQRFVLIIAVMITLMVSYGYALLNVGLITPSDEATINQLQTTFSCVASGGVRNITLRLKQGSMWYDIQTKSAVDWQQINFDHIFPTGGTFLWNCLARDNMSSEFLAPSDFTLNININTPPTISPAIPNQEKNLAQGAWLLNLQSYKHDNEDLSSNLRWNVTGVDASICNVEMVGDVASFTPIKAGSKAVSFILTDSGGLTATQSVTITVTQSQTNTAPAISGVSDMTKVVGDDWTIGLNSKISDAEDSDDKLNISVSGVDTSIFTVSVNDELNELAFEAVDEGTDSFTITVADTKGATASQTVTVSIEEQSSSSNEEEPSSEFAEEFSVEITAAVPDENKKVSLKPGQSQKFEITLNEDADIEWKVDGIKVQTDSKSYTYIPKAADIGSHTVDVIAGLGADKDMKTWTIEVAGEQNKTVNLCGNKKVDANETCLTCPADVVCKEGEYCNEGVCKQTKSNLVTGYAAVAKDFIVQEWYYPTLGFGIILLLIIASKIIRMNKKVKRESVSDYLAEFSEKKTRWGRIRERLREWDKMRQLRKKNRQNLKILEKEKKSKISINAPGIESIVSFVNQKTQEGNSKREIKKALKSKGWSRKQIKLAFKKIKYDSRKSA